MSFCVGDKVIKNPLTWQANEFDSWGRGEGQGVIVDSPIPLDGNLVDVRWPNGKCFEDVRELMKADENV